MRSRFILSAALAVAACGVDDSPPPDDRCPNTMAVPGQAETALIGTRSEDGGFTELEDNELVPLVIGMAQGEGNVPHLRFKVRLYSASGREARNRFTLVDLDTEMMIGESPEVRMSVCAPGWADSPTYGVILTTTTSTRTRVELETTLLTAGEPDRHLVTERTCMITR